MLKRQSQKLNTMTAKPDCSSANKLKRTILATSRAMDFFSEKELVTQTGHSRYDWPLVVLKELMDNALDACEEAGIDPEVSIVVDGDGITVSDNGPGIPADTVDRMLDFSVRVSSREAYVAPDRGAQGNALKTIVVIPSVLDGSRGCVEIEACGIKHNINVGVDNISQTPNIGSKTEPSVKNGTSVKVFWPDSARSNLIDKKSEFLPFAENFVYLNPHLTLTLDWLGERIHFGATIKNWSKWRPDSQTPAHWYSPEHLSRLVAGYITSDRSKNRTRTIRDFIGEFRGLSSTKKRKVVLGETNFGQMSLEKLAGESGVDKGKVEILLASMCKYSDPVKPSSLGIIGKEHIEKCFKGLGCQMTSFNYKIKHQCDSNNLPFVIETAFAWCPTLEYQRRLITGVNWSPGIVNPFRELGSESLDSILEQQKAGYNEPVIVFVHLVHPRVEYTDRGKSAIIVDDVIAQLIHQNVVEVTKRWTKQRKAEERKERAEQNRWQAMTRSKKVSVKDVVWDGMEEAYLKASSNGMLPANARQIYYAIRPDFLNRTDKDSFDSKYFTQTLLPDFMNKHPELTQNWDVVYDSRGHFSEPHTGVEIGLGTLDVRDYLSAVDEHVTENDVPRFDRTLYPTRGPRNRCSAFLFIEKEGFMPLFEKAKLAERYDLGILSTKGMSVVAARRLIDKLCHDGANVPLLVLHDFDKSGFSILGTLTSDTRRYAFENSINVIDLGIRLEDVQSYNLASEPCRLKATELATLRKHGATPEEIKFLKERRVELNAFSSGDFVRWIERRLQQHGIQKMVPNDQVLLDAYRLAVLTHKLNKLVNENLEKFNLEVKGLNPLHLEGTVRDYLRLHPEVPWDRAINEIIQNNQVEAKI